MCVYISCVIQIMYILQILINVLFCCVAYFPNVKPWLFVTQYMARWHASVLTFEIYSRTYSKAEPLH